MKVRYCGKCHNKKRFKNIDSVKSDIEKINKDFVFVDQCLSYCGPGKDSHFCTIDDEMFVSKNYDSLLKSIEEEYDN